MNDPFANLGKTDASTVTEGKPAQTAKTSSAASYFLDFELGEKEFEQPVERPYQMPAEGSWVPVEIMDCHVVVKPMRRVLTNPDTGSTTIEDQVETPRFEMDAQLFAQCYGIRRGPYLLGMPIEDVIIPFKQGSTRKGTGFEKMSGRKLIAATRVLSQGGRVSGSELDELAARMNGKIVMAKVRLAHKDYDNSKPVTDASNRPVRVKVNDSDQKVEIVEKDGQLVMKADGTPFPGDPGRLFKFGDTYYIPDPSDDGVILKEFYKTTRTFDNLNDDVAPVPGMVVEADALDRILDEASRANFTIHQNSPRLGPVAQANGSVLVERLIQVTRVDGSVVCAQVTWDTVGQITAKPVKSGTPVQAVTLDGDLLTATWIGTSWVETPVAHRLEVNGLGALVFVPEATDDDEKGSPLDVFKG